jgi:type IV pilus assembly protein PilV
MLNMRTPSSLRQRRPSGPTGQRGVALIEALISILIFSFGILGLIGLEAQAINYSVNAEDRNRAAMFANEIATYMWVNNTTTPPAAQVTAWQNSISLTNNPQGGLNGGVLTLTATVGTTNSEDIVITWLEQSDPTATPITDTLTTRVILPPNS